MRVDQAIRETKGPELIMFPNPLGCELGEWVALNLIHVVMIAMKNLTKCESDFLPCPGCGDSEAGDDENPWKLHFLTTASGGSTLPPGFRPEIHKTFVRLQAMFNVQLFFTAFLAEYESGGVQMWILLSATSHTWYLSLAVLV